MTNATLPTSNDVSLMGGLVKIYVNQIDSLTPVGGTGTQLVTINGTNFKELVNFKTGAVLGAVPASTNLRIFGVESYTMVALSLCQLGYDDDGAGTNFTLLFDLFAALGPSIAGSNLVTGMLTVPTGKHLVLKQTNTAAQNTLLQIRGLFTN